MKSILGLGIPRFVVAVCTILLTVGPAVAQGTTTTAVLASRQSPQSIDPAVDTTDPPHMIIEAVYESLVEWDPKQEKLVPMLATAWKVTPDGLSYTFEIRQGVKFHDGSTLTARDVKVSLDRIREIGLGNSYLLGPVKSVTAIDDYTVEVTLSEPYAPFLAGLPLAYIVSSTAIAKHDQGDLSRDWLSMNEAGTGPYVLASWDLNQQFTLEKFSDYWRGWDGQHIDRYIVRQVQESVTQLTMLRRGDVQWIDTVAVTDIPSIKQDPDLVFQSNPGVSGYYFALNSAQGPLQDVRVRKALKLAFDPRPIVEQVLKGQAQAPAGVVPPTWYQHNPDIKPVVPDLEQARQLLQEAGYPDGLELSVIYFQPFDWERIGALLFQSNLQEIGVTLNIQGLPWPTLLQRLQDPDLQPDIAIYGKYIETASVDSLLYPMFHSSSGNWSHFTWNFPKVDSLLDQARATLDDKERTHIYQELQLLLEDLVPVVPLTVTNDTKAMSKNLQGWVFNPLLPAIPDYYGWSLAN